MHRRTEELPLDATAHQASEQKTASKKSVIIYIATLFLVVIFFIVLSYLINNRNSSQIDTLHQKNATAQQNIEDLQSENISLKDENAAYEIRLAELEEQVAGLEGELRQTRINWRNDVQDVLTADSERYNELLVKYNELTENDDIKVDSND
jgi:uncharacterized membrane protein YvbJ